VYLRKIKNYDNANEKRANENALTNLNDKFDRENRFAIRERINQEADVDSDLAPSSMNVMNIVLSLRMVSTPM
jgi:hypothetical protein